MIAFIPQDYVLVKIKFEHCPRKANNVAHELDRTARLGGPSSSFDDLPASIVYMLIEDAILTQDQ